MRRPFLWNPLLDPYLEHESRWSIQSDGEHDGEEDEDRVENEKGCERPAEGPAFAGGHGPRNDESEADGSDGDEGSGEGGLLEDEEERVDGEGRVDEENLELSRKGRVVGRC